MKKAFRMLVLCLLVSATAVCSVWGAGAEAADAAEPLTVDLDLSGLSGTLVYAQVYNLLSDPKPWLGKVIKMSGYYSWYQDPDTRYVYHACVIPDATACCAQGIEFVWAEERVWPEEYPEEGAVITVTGCLEMYLEGGYEYLHLTGAELVWTPEEVQE